MSEILTQRLSLCPVARGDAVFVLDHWGDPVVRHGLLDGDTTQDNADSFASDGYGLWLILKAHTREAVGTAGLRRIDGRGLELFYSITPEYRGNGYATEAARGVVEFAVARLGWM